MKLATISHTRWAFYEAMDSDDKESMASWFETLFHHYQDRGKKMNRRTKDERINGKL